MNSSLKLTRILAPILVVAAIVGCTMVAPTPPVDTMATMVQATFNAMTLQAPLASPTPIAPTATLTATPVPPTATVPAAPAAIRLTFAPGATFGFVQGTLQLGQSQTYVLEAMKGQPLIAMVDSYNHDNTLDITGKNSTVLLAGSQKLNSWQGLLPSTQDYFFKVGAGASAEDYTLSVTIASRIQFASGATSATVTGSTVNGYNVTYVLYASGGQTMNIALTVPAGTAALTIWGFSDGQPYQRSVTGSTTFNMVLPSTQDYIIEVVPMAGQVVNYSMKVEVK